MNQKDTIDVLNSLDQTGQMAEIYQAAFEFGEKYIAPLNSSLIQENAFPPHVWEAMGGHDLLGMNMPSIYGGCEAGFLAQTVVTAAISYHSPSIALSQLAHVDLCMGRINKHGTEEQKAKFLPGLIKGNLVGALAMSEPGAGSDVMSMTTRAKKVDGGWNIIQGEKTWITNGGTADVLVIYAKTDEKKLTAFLVEKGMKGFSVGNKIDKIGMRGSETYSLHFEDCFIPDENVLGEVNCGGHILMNGLNTERVTLSAAAIAIAENSLDIITKYTTERHQFGKALNQNQDVAFDLADMQSSLWMNKRYAYSQAALYDRNPGTLTNPISASIFLESGRMCEKITAQSVKLAGGMGYTNDLRLGQNMNDGMLHQIGGGTENIRRLVIARSVLAD